MNPDYSPSSNSNNNINRPHTIDDYIALLKATREKYGNLQVRNINTNSYDVNDVDEYREFNDLHVVVAPQSLLTNNNNTQNSYLVFESSDY
jgi:site-specific DNA-adenine methylase